MSKGERQRRLPIHCGRFTASYIVAGVCVQVMWEERARHSNSVSPFCLRKSIEFGQCGVNTPLYPRGLTQDYVRVNQGIHLFPTCRLMQNSKMTPC